MEGILWSASKKLVQEFYANTYRVDGDELKEFKTKVRGKDIYLELKVLERLGIYYASPFDFDYHSLVRDKTWDPEEVINTICISGTQWTLDSKGQPQKFQRSALLPIPKARFTFVQHCHDPHLGQ